VNEALQLPEVVRRRLDNAVADAQRRFRAPGVGAGVVRDGSLLWSGHVGRARLEPPRTGDDDTAYLIGSVTKTFSAVVVMQLRDEGALSLTDRLGRWLPDSRHADLTVRDLLGHASGLQREPVGRIWESLDAPDTDGLLRGLEEAEAVLDPHTAWHYSNLAYALLGRVIEVETGTSWEDALRARVLEPLGMSSTGLDPDEERTAHGYHVHPHTRVARREPRFELRATAPLGGLWSTVSDMASYLAFVAEPGDVLATETLDEMCRTVIMRDRTWTSGHGLGWMLVRHGDRVVVGHSGGMPGFVTGVKVDRESGVGAVVFVNSTAGADPMALAWTLLHVVLEGDPAPPEAWVPEADTPDYADLLGSWWMEGSEIVLEVRDGELWSRFAGSSTSDARWRRTDEDDVWCSVEGYEQGERLEVVRDASGTPGRLYLATYAVTRQPRSFGDLLG
jgi:CubicO group peptidase (beta-lactamase class C family)